MLSVPPPIDVLGPVRGTTVAEKIKDAFLCHNKADKDWVRVLSERIEAETLDEEGKARNLSAFFDEWDIDAGENCVNRMNDGLRSARFVIVVMSPEFFRSGWTNFEWTDVVSSDPLGAQKRLIPILLRDVSLDSRERISYPAPFKALNHLDFRDKRRFEGEFQKLLRRLRGLPPLRGRPLQPRYSSGTPVVVAQDEPASWQPDRVRDLLLSNLLPVHRIPVTIWSAKTEKTKPIEVWQEVPGAEGHIIRGGRLWSFADLSSPRCAVRAVIETSTITKESSRDWLLDTQKFPWLIALLNQALCSQLSKLAIKKDDKGRFFFRPNKDGTTRVWRNGDDEPREVAAKKLIPTGGSFWVHHAASIAFKRFGDRLFIQIKPTYLFTTDGNTPLGGQQMGKMAVMWGGRQRNPDILRNLIFWAKTLAHNKKLIEISTGGEAILASVIPGSVVCNVGIDGDHVRIRSLMKTADNELDQAAQDVEVVENCETEARNDDNN